MVRLFEMARKCRRVIRARTSRDLGKMPPSTSTPEPCPDGHTVRGSCPGVLRCHGGLAVNRGLDMICSGAVPYLGCSARRSSAPSVGRRQRQISESWPRPWIREPMGVLLGDWGFLRFIGSHLALSLIEAGSPIANPRRPFEWPTSPQLPASAELQVGSIYNPVDVARAFERH